MKCDGMGRGGGGGGGVDMRGHPFPAGVVEVQTVALQVINVRPRRLGREHMERGGRVNSDIQGHRLEIFTVEICTGVD
jgi:hypothetical protein